MSRRPTALARALALTLAFAPLALIPAGCEQLTSPGATTYKLDVSKDNDGHTVVTYALKSVAIDDHKGSTFAVYLAFTGVADENWRNGAAGQPIDIEVVGPTGPAWELDDLIVIPEGGKAMRTGEIEPQTMSLAWDGAQQTGNGFYTVLSSAVLRSMVGAKHCDFVVATVRFRLDDAEIRGVAEMMRKLDADGYPK